MFLLISRFRRHACDALLFHSLPPFVISFCFIVTGYKVVGLLLLINNPNLHLFFRRHQFDFDAIDGEFDLAFIVSVEMFRLDKV